MSIAYNTAIVRDSLVFQYDMSNTRKSWKGAPTTNILSSPSNFPFFNYINTGAGAAGTITSELQYDGTTAKVLTVTASTLSSSDLQFYSSSYSLTGGITYSVSCMIYTSVPFTALIGVIKNGAPFDNYITMASKSLVQGWNYISTSGLVATSVTDARFELMIGTAPTGSIIKVNQPQIEAYSFATPFVDGSRSSTTSILDLTRNTTITATSLTYAGDNTFSFNGTSDYAQFSDITALSNTNFSIECVIKPASFTGDPIFLCPQSNGIDQYCRLDSTGRPIFQLTTSADVGNRSYTANSALTLNRHSHLTFVKSASNIYIYINGVLDVSSAADTLLSGSWGSTSWVIGQRGNSTFWYSGQIPIVRAYNKSLSAAEVQTNFSAIQGRYSL